MAKYEVTLSLMVTTMVKLVVEADSKEDAIEKGAELMPANYDPERSAGWKADITLKAPKAVTLARKDVKGMHFQAASGGEKAKKIA